MADERPWGFSIFCDDLRQEVDGKRTLVGTYMGEMNIYGTLPALLPKLVIATTFYEPHATAATRDWEVPLHMMLPGETFDSASFKVALPAPPQTVVNGIRNFNEPNPDNEPLFTRLDFQIMLVPFIINAEGRIKIRAMYQDEIIRLGSINMVVTLPPPTTT